MNKKLASILFTAALGLAASTHADASSVGMYSAASSSKTPDAASLATAPFASSEFTLAAPPELSAVTGLNYSGTTVGGPTFNRPLANGNSAPTSLSANGTGVSYDVVQFTIATAGNYSFLSTSVLPANWDNFTVLYQNSFNPASPLTNALVANDDLSTIGRSGFTYPLQTGVNYFFVTTGFDSTSKGSFTNTVTAVPEPNVWAMMGAGLVGLMVIQRARRQA